VCPRRVCEPRVSRGGSGVAIARWQAWTQTKPSLTAELECLHSGLTDLALPQGYTLLPGLTDLALPQGYTLFFILAAFRWASLLAQIGEIQQAASTAQVLLARAAAWRILASSKSI